jgi:dephospho-CoA kinase
MVYVVGLTGGIGSGKSAAAEAFAARGVTIVDADAIAHSLTGPTGAAMPAIRAAFGDAVISADGSLDRAAMRHRAFTDPGMRQLLEGILHPLIRAESERQLAGAPGPYAVHVVPLLVESGARRHDRVLVIDADPATQIARVRTRGLTDAEIRRIIATQASREARIAAADDVIENDGSLDELRRKVEELHRRYLEFARMDPKGSGNDPAAGA